MAKKNRSFEELSCGEKFRLFIMALVLFLVSPGYLSGMQSASGIDQNGITPVSTVFFNSTMTMIRRYVA